MSFFHLHKKKRFLHPFFIFNILNVIGTFAFVLLTPSPASQQENLIFAAFGFLSITNLLNSPNIDAYLSKVFFYVKCCALIVSLLRSYSWFAVFAVLNAYLFFFEQPPIYQLENVKLLRDAEWEDSEDTYFVVFDAPWSPEARLFTTDVFEFLARKYANQGFHFARVDVGRTPELADSVAINTSSMSTQLPAVALFEKGKLLGRIPMKGKSSKDYKMTATGIENMFDVPIRSQEALKAWKKRQNMETSFVKFKKSTKKPEVREFKVKKRK